ncbi:hypothetical protein CfE428DRAFT_1641 [Chthoniobacter flavus Ellin428]|uniref:Uncharacterized protein n=1 Tax=Chthoniobacter flavus Ellin428 TaxID=497964 RepID=B4CX28_9BACT|nr:hypothetical protein CfE428DRAFT_1641 [Chthoniobacter flavus Ellin428]TCO84883.1 hypothetical protein EV701_1333 [Chthoniobacter flavus]
MEITLHRPEEHVENEARDQQVVGYDSLTVTFVQR